jgi:glycosyltransferase involved in cell wall biosynthesis
MSQCSVCIRLARCKKKSNDYSSIPETISARIHKVSALSKTQPFVSIVMPSFNHSNFIGSAVSSVLEQSFINWELIVIDNFSTDQTMEILNQFNDARIKILQINNQGSIAKSRNLGVTSANGEWIAFLDSDDLWEPDKLEKVSVFFNSEHDLIYHHLSLIQELPGSTEQQYINSRKLKSPVMKDLVLKGNTIATSSVLVRKRIFLEVGGMNENPEVIGVEDYNTWLRISCKTDKFTLVPLTLGAYRIHSTNLSNAVHFKPPIAAINEFLPLLTTSEIRKLKINFDYLKIRTQFLKSRNLRINRDLFRVLLRGSILQKFKILWMLMVSLLRFK